MRDRGWSIDPATNRGWVLTRLLSRDSIPSILQRSLEALQGGNGASRRSLKVISVKYLWTVSIRSTQDDQLGFQDALECSSIEDM